MKNQIRPLAATAALLLLLCTGFAACKKSDTPAPAGAAQNAAAASNANMQGHCDCRTGLEMGTGLPCTCKLEQ